MRTALIAFLFPAFAFAQTNYHPDWDVTDRTITEIEYFHANFYAMDSVPCVDMAQEAIMTLERIYNVAMNSERHHPYSTLFEGSNCVWCECPPPPPEDPKE